MNEEIARVECRKLRSDWWATLVMLIFVAGGLIATILFPDKNSKGVVPLGSLCLAVVFAGFSYMTLLTFRAYIIADENGLRWRDVRKENFARWDEITDFYMDESSTRKAVVETKHGEIDLRNFNNQEALRAFVQHHATNAASLEWTTRHVAKEMKWPQIFSYRHAQNIVVPLLPFFLAILIVAAPYLGNSNCDCGVNSAPVQKPQSVLQSFHEMLAYGGLFMGSLMIVMICAVVASMLFLFTLPIIQFIIDTRPRWKQRIVATPDDITFLDGDQTIRAIWSDVTKVSKLRDRFLIRTYEVETQVGNFGFSDNLSGESRLLQLFREYSQDAIQQLDEEIEIEQRGILGRVRIENGQCVHGFQSRQSRWMLWMVWSFAFTPALWLAIYHPADEPQIHTLALIAFSVIGVILASALTLFYKRNFVATNENGISHHTSFRTKFIAWNDVERFGKNDLDFYIVESADARIRFWGEIAQKKELLETIAQSSTRSVTREWHHI